ncbi:MAG: histidine phosphatase family protein, partial [Proteobacteria bacterium]|nr:histidine phosphatase family protein [Pseudomonadota bacterium]
MKTLTILRHAKSSWKDSSLPDHDRPLNKRGERDVPVMAARIQQAGIRPSLILCSPAVRAWTTAKLIAQEISYPSEFLQRDERLYLAGVQRIIDLLSEQDVGFNSIMIVGHNPGFTDFAHYLVPGLTRNIPTCGVVSVIIDTDDWNLKADKNAELVTYDYPKKRS